MFLIASGPIDDARFSAHQRLNLDDGGIWYRPDEKLAVLACVDQPEICSPSTQECTELTSDHKAVKQTEEFIQILHKRQKAVLKRLAPHGGAHTYKAMSTEWLGINGEQIDLELLYSPITLSLVGKIPD